MKKIDIPIDKAIDRWYYRLTEGKQQTGLLLTTDIVAAM